MFYTPFTDKYSKHFGDQFSSENQQVKIPSVFNMYLKTDVPSNSGDWGHDKFSVDM